MLCELYYHIVLYLLPSYFEETGKFENRVFFGSIEAVPSDTHEPYLLLYFGIHIGDDFSELRCAVLGHFWITVKGVLKELTVLVDEIKGEIVSEVRFGLCTCKFWLVR